MKPMNMHGMILEVRAVPHVQFLPFEEMEKTYELAAESIRCTFRLIDYIGTDQTEWEAIHVDWELSNTLQCGDLNLLKWICTNDAVTKLKTNSDRSDSNTN